MRIRIRDRVKRWITAGLLPLLMGGAAAATEPAFRPSGQPNVWVREKPSTPAVDSKRVVALPGFPVPLVLPAAPPPTDSVSRFDLAMTARVEASGNLTVSCERVPAAPGLKGTAAP